MGLHLALGLGLLGGISAGCAHWDGKAVFLPGVPALRGCPWASSAGAGAVAP